MDSSITMSNAMTGILSHMMDAQVRVWRKKDISVSGGRPSVFLFVETVLLLDTKSATMGTE